MPTPPGLPDELLGLAQRVAGQAGAVLLAGLDRPRTAVDTKSSATDMVTEMDRAAERLIVEAILAERPSDGVLGEEGAEREGTSGVRWVVDPLDGTTNYLYHHPPFAVSIAAELDGEVVAAVVLDPVHRETFTARRGQGAFRNGAPVRRGPPPPLATALVATGFAYDRDVRRRQAEVLVEVLPQVRDIRRLGAAAVDLCSVAHGRVDAYFEAGLAPWDLAAGALIAAESGCIVAGLDGSPPQPGKVVLAAPPGLFNALCDLLVRAGAGDADTPNPPACEAS